MVSGARQQEQTAGAAGRRERCCCHGATGRAEHAAHGVGETLAKRASDEGWVPRCVKGSHSPTAAGQVTRLKKEQRLEQAQTGRVAVRCSAPRRDAEVPAGPAGMAPAVCAETMKRRARDSHDGDGEKRVSGRTQSS